MLVRWSALAGFADVVAVEVSEASVRALADPASFEAGTG
ncbi:hypothetical protein SUDANB95_06347 [Actinosynnema sp. ALI-1.44]